MKPVFSGKVQSIKPSSDELLPGMESVTIDVNNYAGKPIPGMIIIFSLVLLPGTQVGDTITLYYEVNE